MRSGTWSELISLLLFGSDLCEMTHLVINIIILLFLYFSFTLSYSEGSKAAANPGLLGISGPAVRLTQRVLLPNRYELNRSSQAKVMLLFIIYYLLFIYFCFVRYR